MQIPADMAPSIGNCQILSVEYVLKGFYPTNNNKSHRTHQPFWDKRPVHSHSQSTPFQRRTPTASLKPHQWAPRISKNLH
ncbi:hypothetical protein CRUP_009949, partial [Coryphaenoides rupestris]